MSDESPPGNEKGAAVVAIFNRAADFARELMAENQSLRDRLESMETRDREAAENPHDWAKLRHELRNQISSLETENRSMAEHLRQVESENHQFAERYVEIEEENNNLANLYIASYQLHSTLDPGEVLNVILEIVINLIGADVFCIYVFDEQTGSLEPVAAEGRATADFPTVAAGQGLLGQSVSSGEVVSGDLQDTPGVDQPVGEPVVSIPLSVDERPVGAIAIHSLLQQKDGFTALDHELFTLLAGHAATAIFASRLYSQSERKLSTIQGFIDLLTR